MITRLILFDIDGTLLMSKGIGRESKRRAMQEYYGEVGNIDNHVFGGKTDWYSLIELLEPFGKTSNDIGRELPMFENIMAQHMNDLRNQYVADTIPYAMELVNELRERDDTMVGLVTGNMSKTARIKLEMAGYDFEWFAVGAYGNESPDRNDLPRLAIERAQALTGQTFTGEQVIVIGDTAADIHAAQAVSATSVAVCTGFVHRDKLICQDPDFLLADLSTFVDLIMV
jgi:phosphoglycolate phosphatase